MGQKYASYNTSGILAGFYDSVDSPVPPGVTAIPITDAEWQDALGCPYRPITVVNGALIIPSGPTLGQAQSAQNAILQSSAQKAEQAPLTYTTAGGVVATFLMTPHQWTKFMGAYLKYVVKGDVLPSGYAFYDQNGKPVPVTVADISGIFDAGMAQIEGAMSKLSGLVGQVEVPGSQPSNKPSASPPDTPSL